MSRGGNATSRSLSRSVSLSPATRVENALREETQRRHQEARERFAERSRSPAPRSRGTGLVLASFAEVEKKARVERLLEQIGGQLEAIRVTPS